MLDFKAPRNSLQIRLKRYGAPMDKLVSRDYVEVTCHVINYEMMVSKFAALGVCAWYDRPLLNSYCVIKVSLNWDSPR